MKKMVYAVFVCLFITTSIFTFKYFSRHTSKHKHKSSISAQQLSMTLPANITFDAVQGQYRDKIIEAIKQFPQTDYQLFSVPKNGYFYLDDVDDMIKGVLKKGLTWESHIQKTLQKFARPGSTVLDVGAHIGTHTMVLAQAVGANGRVVAFEPQPKIFRELFMNMNINNLKNVIFYWAGVGAAEGQIELSPLVSSNEGGTPLGGGTGQFVQLLTIDSLHLKNVSLIKMDVEGMEDQALDGARETILTNRPVIIIEIQGGNEFGSAPQEIRRRIMHTIDTLESLGYNVTQLFTHDWLAIPKENLTTAARAI